MNRINYFNPALHGLRGLAALMIFIAHTTNGYIEHVCNQCSSPYIKAFTNIGAFGVEIFFFLSGYVIYLACLRTPGKDFFSHRFWRIYPVFILFTLLYFILNHFMQIVPDKDNTSYLFINLLFLNIFFDTPVLTPNAWSITYEIWYYIATFFIIRPLVTKQHKGLIIIGIVLTLYFVSLHPITIFYIMGVFASIIISQFQKYIVNIKNVTANLVQSFSLIILLALTTLEYRYSWKLIIADFNITLVFITLFIFMLFMFNKYSYIASLLSKKFFLILGTVSYTLYLAHPYSYIISRKFTEKFIVNNFSTEISIFIFIILLILSTSILVYIVHFFIEKKIYEKMTGKQLLIPVV